MGTQNNKPTYIGLLNAIAVGEARGDALLSRWAEATSNPAVRETLEFVAIREREHAAAFTKRLCELGFAVRQPTDPKDQKRSAKRLKKAGGKAQDKKKFEKLLGYSCNNGAVESSSPAFARFFDDETIDPQTGALLGRFIAEERDSGRRLRACYAALCGEAPCDQDDPLLQELAQRLDRLTTTLTDLKSLRESA